MPGFLDKLKSGAEKAGFEADRLRRVTLAQSALGRLKHELEAQTVTLGHKVLALVDAGTLAQPELLADCQPVNALRQQIAMQEADIERMRQEKAPEAVEQAPPPGAVAAPVASQASAPAAMPVLSGHVCPSCHIELPADVKFCPNCGSKAVDITA